MKKSNVALTTSFLFAFAAGTVSAAESNYSIANKMTESEDRSTLEQDIAEYLMKYGSTAAGPSKDSMTSHKPMHDKKLTAVQRKRESVGSNN